MNVMKEKIRCDCLEKEAAPCVSACPFHFDAREFIPRVQRGAFNLAYRHYANSVAFPRIISEICDGRCRSACPRGELDSAVDLKELERAAAQAGVRAVFEDFRPFYPEATRRSRELGMYRQNYCGCAISDLEASAERAERKAERKAQHEAERAAHADERAAAEAERAAHKADRAAYDAKQARKRAILKALREQQNEKK